MSYPINKRYKFFFILSFAITIFSTTTFVHAGKDNIEEVLFAGVDYPKVFDQREVLAQFPDVLEQEGLNPVVEVPDEEPKSFCTRVFYGILHLFTCCCFRRKKYVRKHTPVVSNDYRRIASDDYIP